MSITGSSRNFDSWKSLTSDILTTFRNGAHGGTTFEKDGSYKGPTVTPPLPIASGWIVSGVTIPTVAYVTDASLVWVRCFPSRNSDERIP